MDPDNIDALYQYKVPPRGVCDNCGERDTSLFYETPGGQQLCNDCGRKVTKSFEKRGIGLDAIEQTELSTNSRESESKQGKDQSSESTVKLEEILTKITPTQEFPSQDEPVVEYEYDRVNWETIDDTDRVGEDSLVAWGGAPGSYDTVDSSDFEAIEAYFDSSLSDANVVFVTDEGAYVYDFVADRIDKSTLASEVLSVLSSLSRSGDIEGLRPTEEIAPPHNQLYENLELHQDIEAFEIRTSDDSLICRVVLVESRDPDRILEEIRTVGGVRYPKPDEVQVVNEIKDEKPSNTQSSTSPPAFTENQESKDTKGIDGFGTEGTKTGSSSDPESLPEPEQRVAQIARRHISDAGKINVRELIELVHGEERAGYTSPSELYKAVLQEELQEMDDVIYDNNANVWRMKNRDSLDLSESVLEIDFPGPTENQSQQQNAVQYAYDLIKEKEQVPTRELIECTYAEYTGGYESPSSLYKNCLRTALKQLTKDDPNLKYNAETNTWIHTIS